MIKLIRLCTMLIFMLFALVHVIQRRGPPVAQAAPGAAMRDGDVVRIDAPAPEPYNPWGPTRKDPETRRVIEPKVIARDASGQFHVNVLVNGHDTRFLVDTGADLVALTPQTARDLGISLADSDYQPVLRTASGTGLGAPVWLESVEVAGRRLAHQRAVVAQGLSENLLGQSVLRNLGQVDLKGDTMVLHPN